MLSRVIETTCRLFHSPVKFLRNKHDKVVTGKHLFFHASDEPYLVHTQLEQNYVGLVHFTDVQIIHPTLFLDLVYFHLLTNFSFFVNFILV